MSWFRAMPSPARVCAVLAVALGVAAPASARAPETTAHQLHRRGVHCMEELERPECAIERFEALLDEDTRERALVTDAILRLVKLYSKLDRDEELRAVLRRFWEAGGRRQRQGHLPYSARHLPPDLDFVAHVDIAATLAAPFTARMPAELVEAVTTCDDARRKELGEAWDRRRAQRRASERGITPEAALTSLQEEEKAQRERYKARAKEREAQGRPSDPPVFGTGLCALARALEMDSTATWGRAAFAASHRDSRRSAAIVQIPGLAARIAAAVERGSLVTVSPGRYALAGHEYAGAAVEVQSFDLDEATLAPVALMPEIAGAAAERRDTMDRKVKKLIAGVPLGSSFFAVTTGEAIQVMGLGDVKGSKRRMLEALLPRPTGLQVAGVVHDYFGVFLRMPTDNPVKAGLLVDLVRRLVDDPDADPADQEFLRGLDLTQATDRQALLLSFVTSPVQLESMLLR